MKNQKNGAKKGRLKKIEKQASEEIEKDYLSFSEKIASSNKFYYLTFGVVIILLIGLFLLLHFTNVI